MNAADLAELRTNAATCGICTLARSMRVCDVCRFAPPAIIGDGAFSSQASPALLGAGEVEFGSAEWFQYLPEIEF